MKTTLKAIRGASPCDPGWKKLIKSLGGVRRFGLETPLSVSDVLDSNDMEDALWVLSHACGAEGERLCHLFACDVAERVLHIYEKHSPGDDRVRNAIAVKRRWIAGQAANEELNAAEKAAWAAEEAAWASWEAAGGSDWADRAAMEATWEAAWGSARAAAVDCARAAAWYARAAWDVAGAAGEDARDFEYDWQVQHLRELLTAE